jgi:hypothetical protein
MRFKAQLNQIGDLAQVAHEICRLESIAAALGRLGLGKGGCHGIRRWFPGL